MLTSFRQCTLPQLGLYHLPGVIKEKKKLGLQGFRRLGPLPDRPLVMERVWAREVIVVRVIMTAAAASLDDSGGCWW